MRSSPLIPAQRQGNPDEWVLITGATGAIGSAVTRHLAQKYRFSQLLHYYRSRDRAHALQRELRDRGIEVHPIRGDLSRPVGLKRFCHRLNGERRRYRLYFHAAGLFQPMDWQQLEWPVLQRLLFLHAWAPFVIVRSLRDQFADGARVIWMSDVAVEMGYPGFAGYSTAQALGTHLARILAQAMAPKVTVHVVAPYAVAVDQQIPAPRDKVITRPVRIEDLLRLTDFLIASGETCTGQVMVLDSGRLLGGKRSR